MVPVEDRFWSKVDKTDTCWLWTAGRGTNGYGAFSVGGSKTYAHRFAYELLVGPIPEGLELDHLCRVRQCVNPGHMEPVTHAENMRRGAHSMKTHCPQGHPYDEANTHVTKNGFRHCRTCRRRVQITPSQHAKLERVAQARGISTAEVISALIDRLAD